jgi:hypothetical protein
VETPQTKPSGMIISCGVADKRVEAMTNVLTFLQHVLRVDTRGR